MTSVTPDHRTIDLLDGEFYTTDPYPTYAWMREHAPVYWDAANELWGISRYDDIVEIEKHKERFINSDQAKGGYRPKRTIVIAFSGDEETTMKTSRILADRFPDADMVLNTDGSGGALDEATGKPLFWTWDGAEKTYVDVQLEVTNWAATALPRAPRMRLPSSRRRWRRSVPTASRRNRTR